MSNENIVTPYKLYDPNLVDNLSHLPKMCIFGLIDEVNKTILIYRTKNIVTALNRIIRQYEYSNKKILKLPLVIIEDIKSSNNLWIRYSYWNRYYSNMGYNIFNKSKYNIAYKVHKEVYRDFRSIKSRSMLFYVSIVSRRGKGFVVGIFDKVNLMDEFVSQSYPNGAINNIIYSDNSLTREYYAK
jgi:hypothetical protein